MKKRIVQFNLKWLLVLVAITACLVWSVTQLGMVTAHFEIKENFLESRGDSVIGRLWYRFARTRENAAPEYFDFVCTISNLKRPQLLELKTGDKFRLRYRLYDIGPLKQQNPYTMFLTDKLGIDKDLIKGYANFDGWTEVVVVGAKSD